MTQEEQENGAFGTRSSRAPDPTSVGDATVKRIESAVHTKEFAGVLRACCSRAELCPRWQSSDLMVACGPK